jgi:vesicle transport through interaction with t-SNAREs protein 1
MSGGGGGGSDILRNYEQQFGILCADITSKISRTLNQQNENDRKDSIKSIEALFVESRELIEQMELEIRDSTQKRTQDQKEKYLNIINGYKNELNKLETEFNRQLKSKSSAANFEIQLRDNDGASATRFLNRNDDDDDNDDDNLELNKLRQNNKGNLSKMNNKLENGYKMILETEETGQNILSDLFGQREQLQRARERLRETNLNLGKSSRIVGEMTRRLMQNKLILFGICAVLILFVVFIIYLLVKKGMN